jgi:hypothetical protein
MPATKTQLLGGSFQTPTGSPLANGTLRFHLSQDCLVPSVGTICSGIDIIIQLDSQGNVASSISTPAAANQFVWSNLAMSPQNNFYRVTGFTSQGQRAFGPNNQQVGSGATFNLDAWLPNTVISWFPATQPLLLEVNSTPAESQIIANFTAGAGITITDLGNGELEWASTSVLNVEVGGTPITSTNPINFVAGTGIAITNPSAGEILISASGSGSPAGSNVVTMPILNPTTVSAGLNGFTLVFKIPATYIVGVGPSVQVGLLTTATLPFIVNAASIGATLPGSSVWTTSPVPLTWPGGSFSSAGTLYLSNPAAITIDTAHDYYIAVYIDPSSSAGNAYFTTSNAGGNVWQAYGGITGFLSGNHSSDASATSLMSPIGSDIFSIAQIIIG